MIQFFQIKLKIYLAFDVVVNKIQYLFQIQQLIFIYININIVKSLNAITKAELN